VSKGRLEAFSDGVIAILITIMVLGLTPQRGADPAALQPLIPTVLSYVLSFIFLGIYWNNHHHLLQIAKHVNGRVLWANLHLLFWLSLVPFVTSWMGNTNFATWPVALYGVVLLGSALAFTILVILLVAVHGQDSTMAAALRNNTKGNLSLVLYLLAIPLAFVNSWLAGILYAIVAAMWLVPDTRIERVMPHKSPD
jgi:uncharacterized membrane protein